MKKNLKSLCAAAVLPLMLMTNGCFNGEISDEKGKEWAEENGYVKSEEYPVVGVYNFEYVFFGEEDEVGYRVNSCADLSGLPSNPTIDAMIDACQEKASTRIEITENGMFKVIEPNETKTWKYLINEKGELLVSPLETDAQNSSIKDVYYNLDVYKLENGRVYLNNLSLGDGIDVVGVYKHESVVARTTAETGVYNFEYVFFGEDGEVGYRVNSCADLSGLPSNPTIGVMIDACQEKASTRIEITENGMFKVIEPNETKTWKYLINEKGELLISPLETDAQNSSIKDVYYNLDAYKLENGRVYLNNLSLGDGIEVIGVYKK